MKFKLGDIITAKPDSGYNITTNYAIMKIIGFGNYSNMEVEIIHHHLYPNEIGNTYPVTQNRFKKIKITPELVAILL